MLGLVLLFVLLLFSVLGPLFVDVDKRPAAVGLTGKAAVAEYPFGTDSQGRDLLAVMVAGTPLTLRIGVMAGLIGLAVGTTLAFVSAYYGGAVDAVIRGIDRRRPDRSRPAGADHRRRVSRSRG